MRLIDCETLQLRELFGKNIPPYAILSHTWEDDEITYQEFHEGLSAKKGWLKVEKACYAAAEDGHRYIWVDTCCIDKTDSAELSEAINSMFAWYANAIVCYVYLGDWTPSSGPGVRHCRWFTRGWTLQELVAPCRMEFLDSAWTRRGSKQDLGEEIANITKIDMTLLGLDRTRYRLRDVLDSIPIGRRMSWLSKRQTTREEDIAYCALGIFGVNMTFLYGEGDRAFIRLQEEIIRRSNDLSILAWNPSGKQSGVLAVHPSQFVEAGDLERSQDPLYNPEFTLTNKGIRIEGTDIDGPCANIPLYCHRRDNRGAPIILILEWMGNDIYGFGRQEPARDPFLSPGSATGIIFLATEGPKSSNQIPQAPQPGYNFIFWDRPPEPIVSFPTNRWERRGQHDLSFTQLCIAADAHIFVRFRIYAGRDRGADQAAQFVVAFGFGVDGEPWVSCASEGEGNPTNPALWHAAKQGDPNAVMAATRNCQHYEEQGIEVAVRYWGDHNTVYTVRQTIAVKIWIPQKRTRQVHVKVESSTRLFDMASYSGAVVDRVKSEGHALGESSSPPPPEPGAAKGVGVYRLMTPDS